MIKHDKTYIGLFSKHLGRILKGRSELFAMTTPRSKELDHHSLTLLEHYIIESGRS